MAIPWNRGDFRLEMLPVCRAPWEDVPSSAELPACACRKPRPRSCDQAIFVDQATDASVSSDAVLVEIDRVGQRCQRRGAVQAAVRPVLVVVDLVLAQDPPQMVLAPGQGAVQELAAASPDPRSAIAFIRGVRTLPSTVRIPAPARTASNAAVKLEPRSRIMNVIRSACPPRSMSRLRA